MTTATPDTDDTTTTDEELEERPDVDHTTATDDTTTDTVDDDEVDDQADDQADDDPAAAARREAAAYRRRLRDTEAERDTLAATVATYRRREAEALAGRAMQSGADLWAAGIELEELLADDGTVDEARVRDAVAQVTADRPHWRRKSPDLDAGARTPAASSGFDFGAALRGAAGGNA